MAKRFFSGATTVAMAILWLIARPIDAGEGAKPEVRLAQFQVPQLPGLGGAAVDWRQLDAFLTFIVKRFGQEIPADLRESLAEAFLDSRYELTNFVELASAGQNPVPQMLLDGWSRLSSIMKQALPALPQEVADRYANFIGVLDQLAALGQGSQLALL